jgi:hypothetical protein
MGCAIRQICLLSVLALQGYVSSAARSEEPLARPIGVVISGPGFLATVNNLPSDRLLKTQSSDQAAGVTFNDSTAERDLTVEVRVVRLRENAGSYAVPVDSLAEQIFRDDAIEACNGPVRFARSPRPPNVASAGAIPIRLEAICDRPKDARWVAVQFTSEAPTNGTVRCVWAVRQNSLSADRPSLLPVHDICGPMDATDRTATVLVIRPE